MLFSLWVLSASVHLAGGEVNLSCGGGTYACLRPCTGPSASTPWHTVKAGGEVSRASGHAAHLPDLHVGGRTIEEAEQDYGSFLITYMDGIMKSAMEGVACLSSFHYLLYSNLKNLVSAYLAAAAAAAPAPEQQEKPAWPSEPPNKEILSWFLVKPRESFCNPSCSAGSAAFKNYKEKEMHQAGEDVH